MSAGERRDYNVGLPVFVTITPDGFVTVEVDLSELGASVHDDPDAGITDEQRASDQALLDAWAAQHAVSGEGFVE